MSIVVVRLDLKRDLKQPRLPFVFLFHFATRPGQWMPYAATVERIIRKMALGEMSDDVETEAARLSVEERMNLFEELLRRGEAFYTRDETAKGYPRVYRVVNLRES